MTGVVLGRAYYSRSALELAPDMLGKLLCRRFDDGTVGRFRIVETEAYYGEEDTACHAHRCSTGRARVMYSAGGLAYVHRCHMYNLLTIVTGPEGHPEGVLIRGVEGHDGPGRTGRASPCTGPRCPRTRSCGWRTTASAQVSRLIPA